MCLVIYFKIYLEFYGWPMSLYQWLAGLTEQVMSD